MLSKRAFLGGAGALIASSTLVAQAAEQSSGSHLRLAAARDPFPQGPVPDRLQFAGGDPETALRLDAGRPASVGFDNAASEAVTLSWRGLRGIGSLDARADPVPPGTNTTLSLAARDGGTALLRAVPSVSHAAERGVRAVVVVQDSAPAPVDRDMVVMLEDWLLGSDGRLRFGSTPPADAVTGVITVNGDVAPRTLAVRPRMRLRLRLVNASTQRLMVVACTGTRPMIAAIDGQPSEFFAPSRGTVPIGPGARYDLLLDMPEVAGRQVRLTLKPSMTIAGRLESERDLLVLHTEGTALPAKTPLAALPQNPNLPTEIPLEAAQRVDLTFKGQAGTPSAPPRDWSVNGVNGATAGKPVLSVRSGTAVVLGLFNTSPTLVPLRIGGHAVRLLHAKDDGWEPYWRDTLLLPPNSRNHVAFVTDTAGRWPIDSNFDDLTLAGLSCFFDVTPG